MSDQISEFVRSDWCVRGQYSLLGLLVDDDTFTLEACAGQLRREFGSDPNARVTLEDGRSPELKVSWGAWEFRVTIASGSQIASESASIARQFARHRPDCTTIALCHTRIEVTSDPDPCGEHVCHYFSLAKALGGFQGMFLFCIASGKFWDEDGGYPLGVS